MKSEHDIDDYKPYKCKHCDYTHNHIRYLAEHVKNHNPNRSFICDICGASLKSASSLKYHKTSYHKKGMQELVCDICGFTTLHLNNLKWHIKSMHGREALGDTHTIRRESSGVHTGAMLKLHAKFGRG